METPSEILRRMRRQYGSVQPLTHIFSTFGRVVQRLGAKLSSERASQFGR